MLLKMIREIKVTSMRPCYFFLHREGVLGIGHLVVFLSYQHPNIMQ